MSTPPEVVAEQAFDLSFSDEKLWARIFAPVLQAGGLIRGCRIVIDDPIDVDVTAFGADSLQALVLALHSTSMALYGSDIWRAGELGRSGRFGGDLGIPATKYRLGEAPFPF